MNNFVKTLTLAAGALALAGIVGVSAPAKAGSIPESDEPIKLALNEWTGQHISTYVAGEVLKKMGYTVEYVTAGYYPQMAALEDGTITATMEIWSSNIGEHYDKALASGKVVELGDLGLDPREAWMYPAYVEEQCPGLPNWEALLDCGEIFAVPETYPSGRFLDYPAEWGTSNVDRIAALSLPLVSMPSGGEGALIAEIKAAHVNQEPLVLMFWWPHWLHAVYDMRVVELPPHEDACYDDPAWGVNSDMTYDCDWAIGHVRKMAWIGTEEKWPGAFRLLSTFTLDNPAQNDMMKLIDVEGRDAIEVVNEWLDANEYTWQVWVGTAGLE